MEDWEDWKASLLVTFIQQLFNKTSSFLDAPSQLHIAVSFRCPDVTW